MILLVLLNWVIAVEFGDSSKSGDSCEPGNSGESGDSVESGESGDSEKFGDFVNSYKTFDSCELW